MARRRSFQNQPTSHGPPSSIHEPVGDTRDETIQEQQAGNNKTRKRSTSFTGFFTKFLPSHRPERSGTLRDQGFWEQQQQQPDHFEPKQRPGLGHRHGSDSIVSSGWNPAVSLPRQTQTTPDRHQKRPIPTRVQSQSIGDRPNSLTPKRQRGFRRSKPPDSTPTQITKETTHAEAEAVSSTTSQQPHEPTASAGTAIHRLVTTFDAKREARRLRRSLKESGDFLGVQGINPHTGVMDVLTPTSSSQTDRTMMSAPEPRGYSESMSDFRAAYQRAARTRDAEEASLERLRQEQERLDKVQRKKDSIRAFQQRVRWRKDRNQWSSVAEPDLSPIADASTRSRTPRSTSEGAIVYPPSIQKLLRWEEKQQQQRSASTPAGLQTPAGIVQSRPGVVAQESSDTVIHTPHPARDGRTSTVPEVFGKEYPSPNGFSPAATRRVSEPASAVAVGFPAFYAGDHGPAPPPKDKQKPMPLKITIPNGAVQDFASVSSSHRDSFLGTRLEPRGASYHHFRDQAIVSPAAPMEIKLDENSLLGGHPGMDRTPTGSPPSVAVRDFGNERNPTVWFVDHPSNPLGGGPLPPRKSHSANHQGRFTNGATATSSQSHRRYLPLNRGPPIPLRLGPSQKHTTSLVPRTEAEYKPGNLMDIGIPSPTSQRSEWAQQLMADLASFGQDATSPPPLSPPEARSADLSPRTTPVEPEPEPEMSRELPVEEVTTTTMAEELPPPPRSAYIPTTTITGYDKRLMAATRGLNRRPPRFDGPAESVALKDDRVIRLSVMEAATKLQLEQLERARGGDGTDNHRTPSRDGRLTRVSATEVADTDEAEAEVETETDRPPVMTTALASTSTSASVQQVGQASFDLLASPPRLPPNVWPSLDIAVPPRQEEVQQHRMVPAVAEGQHRCATEPTTTAEMVPYVPGPGLASGSMSSHQRTSTADQPREERLSVLAKTALLYAQEEEQQQQQPGPAPITPTTSAPQLAVMRERCERLYRRVSRPYREAANRRRDGGAMTTPPAISPYDNGSTLDAKTTNLLVPYKSPVPATTASTYASTYPVSMPKYRYMPLHPSSGNSGSGSSGNSSPSSPRPRAETLEKSRRDPTTVREPATEAARTALVGTHCSAATGRIVHVHSRKRVSKGAGTTTTSTEIMVASGVRGREAGAGDIGGPSRNDAEMGGGVGDGVKRITLKDDPHSPPRVSSAADRRKSSPMPSGAEEMVLRLLTAYWALIAPVFDAGSPISQRFSAGKSTWRDCITYLLALVFVLVVFLAAVWGVRGVLLVAALGRTVVRGCTVLVGF